MTTKHKETLQRQARRGHNRGLVRGLSEAGKPLLEPSHPSQHAELWHFPEPEPAPGFKGRNRPLTSKLPYPRAPGLDQMLVAVQRPLVRPQHPYVLGQKDCHELSREKNSG